MQLVGCLRTLSPGGGGEFKGCGEPRGSEEHGSSRREVLGARWRRQEVRGARAEETGRWRDEANPRIDAP